MAVWWSRGWCLGLRLCQPWGCSCTRRGCSGNWALLCLFFSCCCRPDILRCSNLWCRWECRCIQCWWFCCFGRWSTPLLPSDTLPFLLTPRRCIGNIRCNWVWTLWWYPYAVLRIKNEGTCDNGRVFFFLDWPIDELFDLAETPEDEIRVDLH